MAVPLHKLLHDILRCEVVVVNKAGSVITTVSLAIQECASVTVTMY